MLFLAYGWSLVKGDSVEILIIIRPKYMYMYMCVRAGQVLHAPGDLNAGYVLSKHQSNCTRRYM